MSSSNRNSCDRVVHLASGFARIFWALAVVPLFLIALSSKALAVGLLPMPVLKNVQVQATARYDSASGYYVYSYAVTNPPSNTGEIWQIKVDAAGTSSSISVGLIIPFGSRLIPFDEMLAKRRPFDLPVGTEVVSFGQRVPSGWHGGFGRDGFARFSAGSDTPKISPGSSLGDFELIGPGVPIIRAMQVIPDWILVVDGEATEEERAEAAIVESSVKFNTFSLGPSGVLALASFEHWNQLRDDLDRAVNLGWIPDTALANTLVSQLVAAREALDAGDGTLAKQRLQGLIDTVTQAVPTQRRIEVRDLLVLNVQRLIEFTADTPIPFEPRLTLVPKSVRLPIGNEHTLTAMVVNLADNNRPVAGFPVVFEIIEGPHRGLRDFAETDQNGQARFSYTGSKIGTDKIRASTQQLARKENRIKVATIGNISGLMIAQLSESDVVDMAEVTWTGGPDLVVPFFVPPLIESSGGKTVYITETTSNIGTTPSGTSTTRYYLSESPPPFDLTAAHVVGERLVPALAPNEGSKVRESAFTLPSALSPATYYLAACADARSEVIELNEENNCSFNRVAGHPSIVVAGKDIPNNPPNCGQAIPNPTTLWPPNHKLVTVSIEGVTDADNDLVSIRVERITQDEPVNGLGDGDTSPDGFGIGASEIKLRAERSGLGNGRVYEIGFTAEDGQGGSCQGSVSVGVPHDQGGQPVPINDGANYDSTVP